MENKESFDELYNRLYNENFNELEELRKEDEKGVKKILTIIGVIFFSFIVFGLLTAVGFVNVFNSDGDASSILFIAITSVVALPVLIILMFVLVPVIIKISKKSSVVEKRGIVFETEEPTKKTYKNLFKEKVVAPIITNIFGNSEYYHNVGLTESEYNEANWEFYDIYNSEDKIITEIDIDKNKDIKTKIIMSEVHTQDRRKDSDGDTHYVTMFYGLAGYTDLPKDIGCYLKVVKNEFSLFGSPKDKLNMDMSEFEKIFDVKTDDRIKTMQILTVDIMTELIQLLQTTNVKFEFHINHNRMYIRFHTGEVFEPEVFGKAMQYKNLKKYFDIVSGVKNITEHIFNVIINAEI